MTLHIFHADPHLLVLAKPSGLLAVPGRGPDKQDCLSRRVQARYPDALIVHRLDMDTSGLFLMARGPEAQRRLSMAFADRRVHKRYIAVVAGRLIPPATPDGWDLIDLPLMVDWPNRPRSIVDHARGKPSRTRWRVLSDQPPCSRGEGRGAGRDQQDRHNPAKDTTVPTTRLELEPLTGRSHQLRVHLQALGHPILGDPLYAPPAVFSQAERLLLHATRLAFPHPVTGADLQFESPPDF